MTGKVMASVLWDTKAKGIVFIDYLKKGQTINKEYHAEATVEAAVKGNQV